MRRTVILCLVALLLAGCSSEKRLETVTDIWEEPAAAAARKIQVALPPETSSEVFQNTDGGKLYHCGEYVITLETVEAGDLDKTVKSISGFGKEALTVLETAQEDMKRYEFVWASVGEGTQQIARSAILEDESWHYILTVAAEAETAGVLEEEWNELFRSFTAVHTAA